MPNLSHINPRETANLNGDFARIQTKVAPQNPYDNIQRLTNEEINNSMDHTSIPIKNSKMSTLVVSESKQVRFDSSAVQKAA